MPSSYPAAQDSSFPGYPYVDNTEYILSSYANSWIAAIQAIQAAIGFGTGSIAANPLYSVAFNKSFVNITTRTAYTENMVLNQLALDTTVGDIQPVGSTAVVGNSGKAADAKHVHVGVSSINGRSGSLSLTVNDLVTSFTTPGQILAATGAGTGELLSAGTSGSVLTVGGADPSGLQWAAPSSSSPGDVKFTSALVLQSGWLAANGQAVSRSIYANLMAATTVVFTGIAAGSIISGLSGSITQSLAVGMSIEAAGLNSSATISGVSASSIQVTGIPTAGSLTFTVFPHGNGNGSSTFGVVNMTPVTYSQVANGVSYVADAPIVSTIYGYTTSPPGNIPPTTTGSAQSGQVVTTTHGYSGSSIYGPPPDYSTEYQYFTTTTTTNYYTKVTYGIEAAYGAIPSGGQYLVKT